ncbi:hypothetical protein DIPPA_30755 [Diplonema papillatum]|nr:hypothetical protein DIPPA_30755 [Diplonema papillatum]
MAGACPVVSHNRIHHSKQHGILVKSGAAGSIHDNHLWANALLLANIKLEQGATTTVQSNTR